MSDAKKKSTKVGAGWWKDANGTSYLSCKLKIEGKEHFISIFPNSFKVNEKQPDMNIMMLVDE